MRGHPLAHDVDRKGRPVIDPATRPAGVFASDVIAELTPDIDSKAVDGIDQPALAGVVQPDVPLDQFVVKGKVVTPIAGVVTCALEGDKTAGEILRRALPGMVDQGWGRVVAIASIAAKQGDPYVSAYTASKHGLLGLVRSAAAEVARKGVTVNAVCPAYVDTPMTAGTVATISATTGRSAEEARAALERRQPIGRLIDPEEVADAVLLCRRHDRATDRNAR